MIYMSFWAFELARNGRYWHGNHRSHDPFFDFSELLLFLSEGTRLRGVPT